MEQLVLAHNMFKFYNTKDFKVSLEGEKTVNINEFIDRDKAYYLPLLRNPGIVEAPYVNGQEPEMRATVVFTPTEKSADIEGDTTLTAEGNVNITAGLDSTPMSPHLIVVGCQAAGDGTGIKVWSIDTNSLLYQDNKEIIGSIFSGGTLSYGWNVSVPAKFNATLETVRAENISLSTWEPNNSVLKVVKRGTIGRKETYKTVYNWKETQTVSYTDKDGVTHTDTTEIPYYRTVYFKVGVEPCYVYKGDNFEQTLKQKASEIGNTASALFRPTVSIVPETGTITAPMPSGDAASGEAGGENPEGEGSGEYNLSYTVQGEIPEDENSGETTVPINGITIPGDPSLTLSVSVTPQPSGETKTITIPTMSSRNNHLGCNFTTASHKVNISI